MCIRDSHHHHDHDDHDHCCCGHHHDHDDDDDDDEHEHHHDHDGHCCCGHHHHHHDHDADEVFTSWGVETARKFTKAEVEQMCIRDRGKYVQFVDSDDYLDPDFTERLVTAAEANNADLVIAPYWMVIPANWYLCLVNDPDANEAVLAPFYGGSFNVLSASGQKVFAKGK